jgi:hypothetical protein
MNDRALILLDHVTSLPDVSQAFVVAPDRTVLGASNRGQQLPDPEACLAVYDSLEGLSLYQLDAGYYRWNFGGRTLIIHRASFCTFGVFVHPDRAADASTKLAVHFHQFIADLESGAAAKAQPNP